MAIWMEMRCEFRANDEDGVACWSHTNSGPMGMADDDTNHGALDNLKYLRNQARKTGWKRTKDGWICPDHAALTGETGGAL